MFLRASTAINSLLKARMDDLTGSRRGDTRVGPAPWAARGRCCVPSARLAPAPTPGVSLSCAGCLTSLSAVVVSLHMCVRHGSVRSLQKQIV